VENLSIQVSFGRGIHLLIYFNLASYPLFRKGAWQIQCSI